MNLKVKIKKLHKDAVIPKYAKPGDAGMDLTATNCYHDSSGHYSYSTGIAVEIPKGYVGLVFPRSSIYKTNMWLSNSVGVIDSGYRGEIMVKFYYKKHGEMNPYKIGDRVAQLLIIPYPQIEFEEVDKLSETERGTGGYGSTDLK